LQMVSPGHVNVQCVVDSLAYSVAAYCSMDLQVCCCWFCSGSQLCLWVCCQCQAARPRELCCFADTFFAAACADFAFYGNKLFQSTFIALLYPNVSACACACNTDHVVRMRCAGVDQLGSPVHKSTAACAVHV
jgi:hypothetical protein